MSDVAAVLMALSAAAGALWARPVPLAVAVVAALVALVLRRPLLLVIAVALASSEMGARSWAGLAPPEPAPFAGVVKLAGDPRNVSGALRVDLRVDGRRVEAWARGRAAGRLDRRLAGERVEVQGRLSPLPDDLRRWLAPRHISARMTIDEVGDWEPGGLTSRLANGIRRTIVSGAESVPIERRSLLTGFVLGDDRGQPPEVTYDFRASGLAHLLVVSGQNVAFVLALAGPVLQRLGLRGRLVAAMAVLVLFGVITRWEPPVLRAVAMASVTLLATNLGRPASTVRALALAVTALVIIDPMLVHSVGFRLSVGACVGIALFARRLTALIPGPRPVAAALGLTLAAQAGVAPIMVPTFGSLPVATVLANLAALPASGPLMVWGLAAGFPAGLAGEPLATLAHLPTRAMLAWVAGVARVTGSMPLGHLGLAHVVAAGAALAGCAWALTRGRRGLAGAGAGLAMVAMLLPAVGIARPGTDMAVSVGRGATLWRHGHATVLVLDGASGSPDRLMSALHQAGVRDLDILIASRPGTSEARAAETLQRRFPAGVVLAPPKSKVLGATVPPSGSVVEVGALIVHIEHADGRLATTVSTSRAPPR
ncbi:MAG: ComEC/Rec2 family competence protein [Actinomycetota bacterium]